MNSTLDKAQARALHAALLDAFPHRASLSRMVRFGLDENLEAIAGGNSLSDVAFSLIEWAEARGKVDALLTAAREDNATNTRLQDFAKSLRGGVGGPNEAPAVASPSAHGWAGKARHVLASLYAPWRAEIVAKDAGLDTRNVDLSGPTLKVWDSILAEAIKQDRVDAILTIARADYPNNPGLRALGNP